MTQKEPRQPTPSAFESEFPILAFSAGEWIYRRGQRDDCMYVIETGSVELVLTDPHSSGEHRLCTLERGEFLGELGVLEEDRRTSCARAIEDCRLLPLDGMALQQICEQQPGLAFRMLRSLAERCGRLENEHFDMWIDFFHEKADTNPPAGQGTAPADREALVSSQGLPAVPRSVAVPGSAPNQDASEVPTVEHRRSVRSSLAGGRDAPSEPEQPELERTEPVLRVPEQFRAGVGDSPRAETRSAEGQTLIAPMPTLEDVFSDDSTRKLKRPQERPLARDLDPGINRAPAPMLEDSQALVDTQQPNVRQAGPDRRSANWARLVALDEGLQFLIRDGFETTIGRSSRTDPFVPDIDLSTLNQERTVSRRHASVFVHNGQYSLVEHERVANGTSVNGIRLVPGRPQRLQDGDRLCFGTVILMFRLSGG